jgi:hypothetical protein
MDHREFPAALPHGEIGQVFPDIFFVTGTMTISGKPMSFSRNMTIVRQGDELTLINSVRLSEQGLKALENLGGVKNVIRLAGFHGMDDAFYKDRYGAKVWAVKGQAYVAGFDANAEPYFQADELIDASSDLPVEGSRLYQYESATPPEAVMVLLRDGGILVTGDSLQNWQRSDQYFSLMAKFMMRIGGFIKAYNVGPAWSKITKPSVDDLNGLFDLRFEHVLPAHGDAVIGNAKELFRPAIEKAAVAASKY